MNQKQFDRAKEIKIRIDEIENEVGELQAVWSNPNFKGNRIHLASDTKCSMLVMYNADAIYNTAVEAYKTQLEAEKKALQTEFKNL